MALGLINISEVLEEETHFMVSVSPPFTEFWKSWWNLHPVGVVPFPCLSVRLLAELACSLGARGGANRRLGARL